MTPHIPILLVDDNRAWRETLAELLRNQGFEVWTAEGPRSGERVLEEHDALVAIIDCHMPEMNGLDWLRRLGRRLPVLMLSGETDPEVARRALAEGALAFVPKSLAPRELVRSLRLMVLAAVVAELARRVLAGQLDRLLPSPDMVAADDPRAVA